MRLSETCEEKRGTNAKRQSLAFQTSITIRCLQRDRFDFRDEAGGVVVQERGDHAEHGVTEAADVQDVTPLRGLRRRVRLQVDADQLRSRKARALQANLILYELLPLGQHARRAVGTGRERLLLVYPAFAVAHLHAARELAVPVSP